MSATIKTAGQSQGVAGLGPMRYLVGAVLAVSIAAGGFAIGRVSSDQQQAAAVNGGSVSAGAVHPERGTANYRRTLPALTQPSSSTIRDRQRHHPAQSK